MASDDAGQDDSYDGEIVALLHQVGQRLLRSEQERKDLHAMMRDLEEKADQGERAFLTVQDRLHKTEAAIVKRQKRLERMQEEQAARVEKAVVMADKIEEALAQHARINRRLDKMAQDKARTIRKLDRIEEAVTETQEAMRSNAMILMAGQNEKTGMLQATANKGSDGLGDDMPWWQQHMAVRVGGVSAMILLGIFGGWLLNAIDTGQLGAGFDRARSYQSASYDAGDNDISSPPSFEALASYEAPAADTVPSATPAAVQAFSRQIEQALATDEDEHVATAQDDSAPPVTEEVAVADTAEQKAPVAKAPVPKDPMDLDDERLLASMNENPGVVAAQLNEITPSTGTGSTDAVDVPAPPEPVSKPSLAVYTPPKVAEIRTSDFIAGQKSAGSIRERITPDMNLPPVIKEVEKKAFSGMAEAQHDLAAIYTAGHGGVEVDYGRAALWFKEAAIQGIANARYNLGVLYHQGLGVEEDINMAVNWYRAAAEEGHPEAQYNLAIAYIEGIGTNYNPEKASYYFEQAATQGILEAAYNLGLIYENGLTGHTKPNDAIYWYKTAAEMGSPEAQMALDQLAKTLGMNDSEVEQIYSARNKTEKKAQVQDEAVPAVSASTAVSGSKAAARSPKQQPPAGDGYEYIEAQPLTPEAPAVVDYGDDQAMATPVQTTTPQDEKIFNVTHAVIAQIQEQLIRIGLYPGPADGMNDSLTEDAIRAYQAHYDLQADGRPSEALLVHMMTSDFGASNEYGSRAE